MAWMLNPALVGGGVLGWVRPGAAAGGADHGFADAVLEGLSLRAAATQRQSSPMAVSPREVRWAIPLNQKGGVPNWRRLGATD